MTKETKPLACKGELKRRITLGDMSLAYEVAEMAEKLEVAVEALKFYAEENHIATVPYNEDSMCTEDCIVDYGEKAEEALQQINSLTNSDDE